VRAGALGAGDVRIAAGQPYLPVMPTNRDRDGEREPTEDEQPEIADRLRRERPVPTAAFRGRLRQQLLTTPPGSSPLDPPHWRTLAGAYGSLGLLCLVVVALGLLGAGPFSA
jgi:hypothetical protein